MNFDIKYSKNLKEMNFIKIKEVLETQWGTQSQRSLAKAFNRSGCNLGTFKKQTDRWNPPVSERERENAGIKKRKSQIHSDLEI